MILKFFSYNPPPPIDPVADARRHVEGEVVRLLQAAWRLEAQLYGVCAELERQSLCMPAASAHAAHAALEAAVSRLGTLADTLDCRPVEAPPQRYTDAERRALLAQIAYVTDARFTLPLKDMP